jgi:hypothetical protein
MTTAPRTDTVTVGANEVTLRDLGENPLHRQVVHAGYLMELRLTITMIEVHALRRKRSPAVHAGMILQGIYSFKV